MASSIRPKMRNVPDFLKNREMGFIEANHTEREYLKMRLRQKSLKQDASLKRVQPFDIIKVVFIMGCEQSVIGVWERSDSMKAEFHEKYPDDLYPKYVIGERNYAFTEDYTSAAFRPNEFRVVDMCQGPGDFIIFMCPNPRQPHEGYFECHDKVELYARKTRDFLFYSCCVMTPGYSIAVGGRNQIWLSFNFEDRVFLAIPGDVHCISFNEASSNTVIAGVNSGLLYVQDRRTRKFDAYIQVSRNCLKDSVIVDENQIIVTDTENTLVNVDLRMMKVAAKFYGHTHSKEKRPLSCANNMLCATSRDNVIRIWNVYGGNPLHEIKPVYSAENDIRGWLSCDGDDTYLDYFEAEYHNVYKI